VTFHLFVQKYPVDRNVAFGVDKYIYIYRLRSSVSEYQPLFSYRGQRTDGDPPLVGRWENHLVESGAPPKSCYGGRVGGSYT